MFSLLVDVRKNDLLKVFFHCKLIGLMILWKLCSNLEEIETVGDTTLIYLEIQAVEAKTLM